MLANINHMLAYFARNPDDIIVPVVIMVSAIIVAIGLLKPLLFNRIKNKHIRKAALAFSSIAASFVASFIFFWVRGWAFDDYLAASLALAICCIVTYWLYEYTCLRNLIELIGGMALRKALNILNIAATKDDVEAVKAELKKTGEELKAHTKLELKNTANKLKEDKDLKRL